MKVGLHIVRSDIRSTFTDREISFPPKIPLKYQTFGFYLWF